MRTCQPILSFAISLLAVACASEPSARPMPRHPTDSDPMPMPMSEVGASTPAAAATVKAAPVTVAVPNHIEHTWTDALGRAWHVAFRCHYTTDLDHEALAAACTTASWLQACESTRQICIDAELDSFEGIERCEARLRRQLNDVLFPCSAEAIATQVTGIEWTTWIVTW